MLKHCHGVDKVLFSLSIIKVVRIEKYFLNRPVKADIGLPNFVLNERQIIRSHSG
jgi:hypothetical protein